MQKKPDASHHPDGVPAFGASLNRNKPHKAAWIEQAFHTGQETKNMLKSYVTFDPFMPIDPVFDLAFQVLSGGGNSRIADQHGFTPLRLFWALNTEQSYGFRNVLFLRTEKIVPFIISYGTFHPRHRTPLQRRCHNNRSHQADSDTLMTILPLRTPSCVQGLINGLYVRSNRACQLKSRQQYVLPFLRPSCVQGQ